MVLVIGEDDNLILLADRDINRLLVTAEERDVSAGFNNAQDH